MWSNNYIHYLSNGDRNKPLSTGEHLNKIWPYITDITNDLQKCVAFKTQLMITIIFRSSKDNDEERVIFSRSDNIEFAIKDKADEVKENVFSIISFLISNWVRSINERYWFHLWLCWFSLLQMS